MNVIELCGSPKENGALIGQTFKKNIHELAEIRKYLLRAFLRITPEEKIVALAESQIAHLKAKLPDIYEEFAAIAEAAELSLVDLAILNNYTDMRDFYADKTAEAVDTGKDGDGGCSVFSVVNESGVICGQTWDMHASARPHMIHTIVKTPKRPNAHVLTVNGCVGLSGINELGVCIFINNLHCSETSDGLIWPALVRGMLWQETAAQAVDFLKSHMPSSGHNYVVCDPNESYNVETTGKQYEITSHCSRPNSGTVLHTNHYLGRLKSVEITKRLSATTYPRQNALEDSIRPDSTLNSIIEDLFEGKKHSNIDYSPPKDKPHASATCGGIIADLKNRKGLTYQSNFNARMHYKFEI